MASGYMYYNLYEQPKRKWWEKLLGLNKPKYEYTILGPFTFTIRGNHG